MKHTQNLDFMGGCAVETDESEWAAELMSSNALMLDTATPR